MVLRTVLAALAGGIAMFAWLAAINISPLGEIGISHMPRELLVTSTLDSGVGGTGGLYVFPASPEAGAEVPSGFMVYYPDNIFVGNMSDEIVAEFAKDFAQALALTLLIVWSGVHRFISRAGFALVVGLLAGYSSNLSLTIWYDFPLVYTLGAGAIVAGGYLAAGIGIAMILPRQPHFRTRGSIA